MYEHTQDELYHYGVKGMKWGVHRARTKLSRSTTQKDRDAAIDALNKHRSKASAKVTKLEQRQTKLDNSVAKSVTKDAAKAAKIEKKAAKLDSKIAKNIRKSNSVLRTDNSRNELLNEAAVLRNKSDRLHAKANSHKAAYNSAVAKADHNRHMTNAFKTGINEIDMILVDAGRKYVNG